MLGEDLAGGVEVFAGRLEFTSTFGEFGEALVAAPGVYAEALPFAPVEREDTRIHYLLADWDF